MRHEITHLSMPALIRQGRLATGCSEMRIFMRYFVSDTRLPLTFSVCGQLNSKDGFCHHTRCFDWNVLIFVLEGVLHLTSNSIPHELGANQYIFLPAGETHSGHCPSLGKLSYLWVHFKADADFEVLQDPAACMEKPYMLAETGTSPFPGRIFLLFRQLLDLSMEEQLYPASMPDYSLSLLLMELTRECCVLYPHTAASIPPVILSVTEWIKANYHRTFTVKELSAEFGYQADYLSALFKKHMGTSLIRYTNKIRMEASKNLLSCYGLSVKEAAYSCGFPDEKYYMKVFKKLEGMTPTEYRSAFGKQTSNPSLLS